MSDLRFSKDHEWIRVEGDLGTVGITDHAQTQLGDIVFIELPEVGRSLAKGERAAVVESVKAAGEVYAPFGGEVVAVNGILDDNPGRVNGDPEGEGWVFRLRFADRSELDGLMDAESYKTFLETLARISQREGAVIALSRVDPSWIRPKCGAMAPVDALSAMGGRLIATPKDPGGVAGVKSPTAGPCYAAPSL